LASLASVSSYDCTPSQNRGEIDKRPNRARVIVWAVALSLLSGIVTCAISQSEKQASASGEVKAQLTQIQKQTDEIAKLRTENNDNNLKIQSSLIILQSSLSEATTQNPKISAAILALSSHPSKKEMTSVERRLVSTQSSLLASAIKGEVQSVRRADEQKKAAWVSKTEKGLLQQGHSPEEAKSLMSSFQVKDEQFADWSPVGEKQAASDSFRNHRAEIAALVEIGKSDSMMPLSTLSKKLRSLEAQCAIGPALGANDCLNTLNQISAEAGRPDL